MTDDPLERLRSAEIALDELRDVDQVSPAGATNGVELYSASSSFKERS
jgi:hypothetical protein